MMIAGKPAMGLLILSQIQGILYLHQLRKHASLICGPEKERQAANGVYTGHSERASRTLTQLPTPLWSYLYSGSDILGDLDQNALPIIFPIDLNEKGTRAVMF
jgi:hypothetical protein